MFCPSGHAGSYMTDRSLQHHSVPAHKACRIPLPFVQSALKTPYQKALLALAPLPYGVDFSKRDYGTEQKWRCHQLTSNLLRRSLRYGTHVQRNTASRSYLCVLHHVRRSHHSVHSAHTVAGWPSQLRTPLLAGLHSCAHSCWLAFTVAHTAAGWPSQLCTQLLAGLHSCAYICWLVFTVAHTSAGWPSQLRIHLLAGLHSCAHSCWLAFTVAHTAAGWPSQLRTHCKMLLISPGHAVFFETIIILKCLFCSFSLSVTHSLKFSVQRNVFTSKLRTFHRTPAHAGL
jgi:hypothetical protein